MSEANGISAGTVLSYSILSKMLEEAVQERDDARRDLAAAEELHRRQFATLKGEFDSVCARLAAANRGAERNAKINQSLCKKLSEAESERDEAKKQASLWEKLALREASANGARLCGKEEVK